MQLKMARIFIFQLQCCQMQNSKILDYFSKIENSCKLHQVFVSISTFSVSTFNLTSKDVKSQDCLVFTKDKIKI